MEVNGDSKPEVFWKAMAESPKPGVEGAADKLCEWERSRDLIVERRIAELIALVLTNETALSEVGDYASICADLDSPGNPRIRVEPLEGGTEATVGELRCNPVIQKPWPLHDHQAFVQRSLDPSLAFVRRLQQAEFVYSYAITPKRSVSWVDYSDSRSDELSSRAYLPTPLGRVEFEVESGGSTSAETALANPTVVGFGEGPATRREPEGMRSDGRAPSPSTLFGWLLGPEYFQELARRRGEFQPDQLALSAIVSVPSWWTRALISVRTCWLSSPSVEEAKTKCVEDDSGWGTTYPIMLPGDARGVSRALSFIVPHEPLVTGPSEIIGPKATFSVGQPGKVLIEGSRLWRSTVVTVGGQTADRIVVLPNMEAIVAEFQCVEYPNVISSFSPAQVNGIGGPGMGGGGSGAQGGAPAQAAQPAGDERSSNPVPIFPPGGNPSGAPRRESSNGGATMDIQVPLYVWTSEGKAGAGTVAVRYGPGSTGCQQEHASP